MRSLGFRTDLHLRRLQGAETTDRGDHLVVRTPDNPAYRWGNFLLLAAPPDDVAPWLDRFAAELPGLSHRAFGVDGTTLEPGDLTPFTEAGFEVGRSVVMTARGVGPPPRPNPEALCRPLSGDDDWRQRLELDLATNVDEEPTAYREFASARLEAERRLVEAGDGVWFGAFLGDRLVSSLGLFPVPGGLARFQDVETHPELRGRGLAGTLVHHASRHGLERMGARTLVMTADPDYLAVRIYRSVGFAETETMVEAELRS